jgi:hypothetical protein
MGPTEGRSHPEACYFDGWLKCGEEGCQSLVPLFARWSDSISVKEKNDNLEKMKWGDVRCYEGHPIRNPATFEGGPH